MNQLLKSFTFASLLLVSSLSYAMNTDPIIKVSSDQYLTALNKTISELTTVIDTGVLYKKTKSDGSEGEVTIAPYEKVGFTKIRDLLKLGKMRYQAQIRAKGGIAYSQEYFIKDNFVDPKTIKKGTLFTANNGYTIFPLNPSANAVYPKDGEAGKALADLEKLTHSFH